jgi:hypothetical protein
VDDIKSKKILKSIEKAEKNLKTSNAKKDISDMDSKSSVWDHNYVQDSSVSTCSVISVSFIICMLTLILMPLAGLHF